MSSEMNVLGTLPIKTIQVAVGRIDLASEMQTILTICLAGWHFRSKLNDSAKASYCFVSKPMPTVPSLCHDPMTDQSIRT